MGVVALRSGVDVTYRAEWFCIEAGGCQCQQVLLFAFVIGN